MNKVIERVNAAVGALSRGEMIVVIDDEHRENEGDLVVAAEFATPEVIQFMCQHARGLITCPMSDVQWQRLRIPPMVANNQCRGGTAFGVSLGAASGITTGISAHDRSTTIRRLAQADSQPSDFVMPGHVFPLRADPKGVLARQGHTEASIDLLQLAGCAPVAAICEIMSHDGTMARLPELMELAHEHQLCYLHVGDLVRYQRHQVRWLEPIPPARLPLHQHGQYDITGYLDTLSGQEHVVLRRPVKGQAAATPVRIHSECLTGDVFGSSRCDCGQQLRSALEFLDQHGGLLIYLRQEGRGIGLLNKLRAYGLQDQGYDTVEANQRLGFAADERCYDVAGKILQMLGVSSVKLMTNNPHKVEALQAWGVDVVERLPLQPTVGCDNRRYMETKRDKLGHWLVQE